MVFETKLLRGIYTSFRPGPLPRLGKYYSLVSLVATGYAHGLSFFSGLPRQTTEMCFCDTSSIPTRRSPTFVINTYEVMQLWANNRRGRPSAYQRARHQVELARAP